jgi:hypothetical protein
VNIHAYSYHRLASSKGFLPCFRPSLSGSEEASHFHNITVNSQFELTVGSSEQEKPTVRKALTVATNYLKDALPTAKHQEGE